MFKVITRVLIAFVGGLIFSLWMLQTSTTVKTFVGTRLIAFLESQWDAHITYDKVKVNFFSLSMLFKQGAIRPAHHRNYAWKFEECSVHVSIFDLLFYRKVSLHLTFNGIKAKTLYHDKGSDLIDHLTTIFATNASSFEISPQVITINGIDLDIAVRHTAMSALATCTVHMPGRLRFCKKDHVAGVGAVAWHGAITPGGATIICNKRVVMHHEEGKFECYKNIRTNLWHMQAMLKGICSPLDPVGVCTLQALWDGDKGSLTLSRDAHDLSLTLTRDVSSQLSLKGTFGLAYMQRIYEWLTTDASSTTNVAKSMPLSGIGTIDLCGGYDKTPVVQGSLVLSDIKLGVVACKQIALNDICADSRQMRADVSIEPLDHMVVRGDIAWHNAKNYGTLLLTNTQPLELSRIGPSWLPTFGADACSLKLSCDIQGNMQGWYSAHVNDAVHNKNTTYRGVVALKNKDLRIKGNLAKGQFAACATIAPCFLCKELSYSRGPHELVHLKSEDQTPTYIKGFIRWPLFRSLLNKPLRRRLINSNCVFDVSIDQQNFDVIQGALELRKGRFFIPGYYNLVQDASLGFAIDRKNKKLTFKPVELKMTKGIISCQRATLVFDDAWQLRMLHVPLMFDDVLINWGRDFYGLVYGNLLLSKTKSSAPFISGSLALKRSLLKDTFFADKESGSFYGPLGSGMGGVPLGLNIRVTTERPIQARTPTIEAKAVLDMKVRSDPTQGLYAPPSIIGRISLESGVIKFFRNTLNIERGKIQFVAGRINDPVIDLVAKNRIGKYLISLQMTGSQQKPTLLLESSPDLADEQIIGLLFAGSEDATLQSDVTSMVLQNIDAFLFNSVKSPKNRWLDKIRKTFKYVQIMPNLNDVSSQSKLKGSISVDLGDQLRARLQKNLDLQKDFSAQLEYMLSDDINFKIVRDQGGDMGSEVEMRLKLG